MKVRELTKLGYRFVNNHRHTPLIRDKITGEIEREHAENCESFFLGPEGEIYGCEAVYPLDRHVAIPLKGKD